MHAHRDEPDRRILLSPPDVGQIERELLLEAFDSGWVVPAGPQLAAFEAELAEATGRAGAVVLSSGTAALHLALLGVGVGAGDDVLVSDLTFGASAFAVTYVGARPCFVDAEPHGWQIDVDLLGDELRRRAANGTLPAAVIAVDLYGWMSDGTTISGLCEQYGVPLIEDAAEALGARRDGRLGGGFGALATLSFNGNKLVTTGGGGALVGDDLALLDRARYLSTQARQPVPWYEHTEVGFNYRMGSLNAAVGRGQLRTLHERIAARRAIHAAYVAGLAGRPGVQFQTAAGDHQPNHWLTTVQFGAGEPAGQAASTADRVVGALNGVGIEARHGFKPMHLQPVFAGAPFVGPDVSGRLFATSVSLPTGRHLDHGDVARICQIVREVCTS